MANPMANEELFARWLYGIDPNIRQIYAISPSSEATSAPEDTDITPIPSARLVVVREINQESNEGFHMSVPGSNPEIWRISPQLFQAIENGKPSLKRFERPRWIPIPKAAAAFIPAKLERLQLQNFRCFDDKEFAFPERFSVLIGKNGAGKTALLDAVAQILQRAVSFFDRSQKNMPELLSPDLDVHRTFTGEGELASSQKHFPAAIKPSLILYGEETKECGWKVTERVTESDNAVFEGTGKPISYLNNVDLAVRLFHWDYRSISFPLFAYYQGNRRWHPKTGSEDTRKDNLARFDGYDQWTDPSFDIGYIQRWMSRSALLEFQRQSRVETYQAVKEAIVGSLQGEGIEDVRFDAALDELAAKIKNGPWLPFRSLSHGVKHVMALFADLAVRCARLNPHLGANEPKKTGGIVLIDELDLHLHPTWQRRIVDTLRETFPKLQFIATTHSPFILQSLGSNEIISLSGVAHLEKPPNKRGIEEISAEVLGVSNVQRSERFLEMEKAAETLIDLLENAAEQDEQAIERAREHYLGLVSRYSDDPAYLASLRAEAAFRGKRLKNGESI